MPMENLLQHSFRENVIKYGSYPALEVNGQSLNYIELAKLVDCIQLALVSNGVKDKAIIVFNDHSLYAYAAILAINFSGNTVLPVDPYWPEKRVLDALQTVQPSGVVVSAEDYPFAHLFLEKDHGSRLFILHAATGYYIANKNTAVGAVYKDLAYIISTSGSTGIPKFVPVQQKGLNPLIQFFQSNFDFKPSDRFLQTFDITFDVAYFSFFLPLCSGACCCVLSHNKAIPKYLSIISDLQTRGITVLCMVATVLHFVKKYITQQTASTVRYALMTADVFYHNDAVSLHHYLPNARLYNFYGPSEATIFCTWYEWKGLETEQEAVHNLVPIGKPFPEVDIRIIDELDCEVDAGCVGELALSGPQVISSYLGAENAGSFFTSVVNGEKMMYYKTGDLVSINDHGNLHLHGRKDHQVKINGYRVELDEVQVALQKTTNLKCVVVKRELEGASFLRAVIEGAEVDKNELKNALAGLLPQYMIPAEIIFVPQLPVNSNGKLDKKLLQSL